MKKRLLSALLALSVLLGSMPVYALEDTTPATPDPATVSTTETAADAAAGAVESSVADSAAEAPAENTETQMTEEVTVDTSDADLPSNDELFALYMQQLMYPGQVPSTMANWGQEFFEDGPAKTIYNKIKEFVKGVAQGTDDDSDGIIKTERIQFDLPESECLHFSYSQVGATGPSDTTLGQKVADAAKQEIDLRRILDCLLVDCPADLYWYDKVAGFSYAYPYSRDNEGVTVSSCIVSMSVAGAYSTSARYEVDASKVQSAYAALDKAQEIVNEHQSDSTYEKLLAYKNEICNLTSYNDAAAEEPNNTPYGDPWQLIYVFDEDPNTTVVCEGYAKAFQYLCDLSGIDCYTVTGTMGGGKGAGAHMWNIVPMDGQNYLVDVTNCDEGTIGNPDKLFMEGTAGTVKDGYTFAIGSSNITYKYDPTETIGLYPDSILTLASSKYTPPAPKLTITDMPETVTYGDAFTLTAANANGAVTWSATGAAQVDASTGLVTVTGVGDFTITATAGDKSASATGIAVPKALAVRGATAKDKTYDGNANVVVNDVTLEGIVSGDGVSVDLSAVTGTVSSANAGTYETISLQNLVLTGDKAGCYTLAATADNVPTTVTIEKATPTAPAGPFKATYGQKLGDIELPEGWNWAVPETVLNQLGDHPCEAQYAATTNYTGATATLTVTVTAKTVVPTVTVADKVTFTGAAIQPEVTVQVDGVTLTESTQYTVSYSDNTNAGTATVTVKAIAGSGYVFEDVVKTFTIEKKAAPAATTQNVTYRYTETGEQQATVQNTMPSDAGAVTYSEGAAMDEKGIVSSWSVKADGTVVYTLSGNGAAGDTATLPVIVSSQNYEDATINLVITLTDREVPEVTVQPYTKTYNGQPVDINAITKNSGSIEGTWSWKDSTTAPVNVADSGTYQLVFTPNDTTNYAPVEVIVSVMITKAASSVSQKPTVVTGLTYNKQSQELVTAGTATGGTMMYALSQSGPFEETLPTATDADTYTVWYMVKGDDNHEYLQPQELGTVTIAKADPTPEIPAGLTATYGDTLADMQLPQGWTWDDASTTSVGDAGTRTFSATYAETDNYNAYTTKLTVMVNPKDLSGATAQTSGTEFTYNGSEQRPTVTGVTLDNTALSANDYTVSEAKTADAGNYELAVTGQGNYTGSFTVPYTIAKKQVTATVTAQDKVYDGTTQATVAATVPGESLTITGLTGTFARKDVGENLTVTVDATGVSWSDMNNYQVAIPGSTTASITVAPYAYTDVADQLVKIGNGLDTVNAAATASGIPGEQVEGTLTWYGDSARTQALGDSYLFQGSDGATVTLYWTFTPDESATNYDRTPVNGSTEFTLTEKLIPTLQVEPLSKTYDGKAVVLDDLQKKADVAGGWSFDEGTPALEDAGIYTVTLRFAPENTRDYTEATCSVTVTVEPRPVTVSMVLTGSNRIKEGETLPQPKLSYSGVLAGESLTPSVEPVFAGMPAASEAGTYTISWTNGAEMQTAIEALPAAKNYAVTVVDTQVELVILKENVTVQPEIQVEDGKTYRLEAATGIETNQIPQSLQDKGYDSAEKIQKTMYKTASEKVEGLSEENTALYDVNLYYRTGEDEPWQEATEDNFPKEGITVTLPYPDGTNAADFDFVVTHMLTVAGKAGQVETPAVTKTEKGLQFTVHSLSPIAISWKAVSKDTVTEDTVTEEQTITKEPISGTVVPAPSGSSISYYTCPACGYHDWTATDEGYRCDECGYLESVKQLSGYGNVKGVYEPKAGGATAAAAEAIPQTGDESQPVLWAVLMFASALTLGGLLISRRKRNR